MFPPQVMMLVIWTQLLAAKQGLGIFLHTTASRPALGLTQPPVVSLSLWVKRPGLEADRSPPFSAEVKNAWRNTPLPIKLPRCGAQLKIKHRDNFTFLLLR
jgi:hypothetical protein